MVQTEKGSPSAESLAQRDAGDDARQGDGQHEQQRNRLAPKKRARASAPAASVPSTSASSVAMLATFSDSPTAAQISARPHTTPNHFSVKPAGERRSSSLPW